jgi:hypothetical protein
MSQRLIVTAILLLVVLADKVDGSQGQDASIMATFEPLPDLLEQTAISEAMKGYWRQVYEAVHASSHASAVQKQYCCAAAAVAVLRADSSVCRLQVTCGSSC